MIVSHSNEKPSGTDIPTVFLVFSPFSFILTFPCDSATLKSENSPSFLQLPSACAQKPETMAGGLTVDELASIYGIYRSLYRAGFWHRIHFKHDFENNLASCGDRSRCVGRGTGLSENRSRNMGFSHSWMRNDWHSREWLDDPYPSEKRISDVLMKRWAGLEIGLFFLCTDKNL